MNMTRERFLRSVSRLVAVAQHYLSNDTSRHMAIVLGGHALRLGLGLLSSAALARGLGPTGLSTFSVVSAAMMIAVTVGDFGLSNSAVRFVAADLEDNRQSAMTTGRVFLVLKVAGGLAVVAVSLLLARPITVLLHLPAAVGPTLVGLAALGVLATSASGTVSAILQALRRFPQLVGTQTLNAALTLLLMGALFLSGRLTIGNALLVGAGTAFSAAFLGWWLLPSGWRPALRSLTPLPAQDALRLWRFGRWLWISTILAIVLSQLDLLLLNRWASSLVTGHYALALNLALKANVVNQTVHTVLLPSASALTGRRQFIGYIRQSLTRSGLLAIGLIALVPLARSFIVTVYGQAYGPSVSLFQMLIGIAIFDLVLSPLLLLAYPLNMPRQIAVAHVLRVATMVLCGSFLIPAWGGSGAVLAKLAAKLTGMLFLGGLLIVRLRRMSAAPIR